MADEHDETDEVEVMAMAAGGPELVEEIRKGRETEQEIVKELYEMIEKRFREMTIDEGHDQIPFKQALLLATAMSAAFAQAYASVTSAMDAIMDHRNTDGVFETGVKALLSHFADLCEQRGVAFVFDGKTEKEKRSADPFDRIFGNR